MSVFTDYWARCLDGREYPLRVTEEEKAQMKADGVVAFYGQSDDLLEACGAIEDEWGAYGGLSLCFEKGVLSAVWTHGGRLPAWITLASVHGEPFAIIEDGNVQSRGIVVIANDLGKLLEEGE